MVNLTPSEHTYTILFKHLGRTGNVQQMAKLYEKVKRELPRKINVHMYNALLSGYVT